ncbi:MAG: DNA-binding transcriptional regulator [Kiritimatiellae bacterium]|nr:DNA-binding transcriptional regulator [Kiritimatiellia bacterium]MDD5519667.1 DNA-binding transcriptional regulator [Kiritimatiellia bacterium]
MKGFLQKTPRVAMFLATNEEAGRNKLHGILRYVRLHTPWNIHLIENRIGEQKLGDLRAWGAAGVIVARMPDSVGTIARARIPTVIMDSPTLYVNRLPRASFLICDSDAIGHAGADYFLKQGFRNFAYVADARKWDWSIQRYHAFRTRLRQAGYSCAVYNSPSGKDKNDWSRDQKHMVRWLLTLPRPIAVLAARDDRARQLLETCHLAGLNVPGDIAILGVDNEEMLCENTSPTLSSIQPDFEAAGYQAAHLLEQLMRHNLRKPQTLLYGVKQIVTRESSRPAWAIDHRLLRGLEFIRLNAGEPIRVTDIARHMNVSRRMAELLFRRHLNHSIQVEIQQTRLTRLKTSLLETSLPIGLISGQCGYQTEMHAKRVFKKNVGITMSQFRKSHAKMA